MLLLLFGGVRSQSNLPEYGDGLDDSKVKALEDAANSIIEVFDPDPALKGIRYSNFVKIVSTTMPDLFEPLNALFEHFMFSKNIMPSYSRRRSPIQPSEDNSHPLLTDTRLSQLSMSLHLADPANPAASPTNIYNSHARFHQIFSTAAQGTSLSSFSRYVMSWKAPTMIIISGTATTSSSSSTQLPTKDTPLLFGAYIPTPWTDSTNRHDPPSLSTSSNAEDPPTPIFFLLSPRHAIFPASPRPQQPPSYFSTRTGIALGCIIPPQPRTGTALPPIPGPASLRIDADLAEGVFVHDLEQGSGTFLCDPGLVEAQGGNSDRDGDKKQWRKKVTFDVEGIEVWGVTFAAGDPDDGEGEGDDPVEKQRKRLEWEEKEAERRRGVNFGGDKDGARHLLEMAGVIGGNRSGGSMG